MIVKTVINTKAQHASGHACTVQKSRRPKLININLPGRWSLCRCSLEEILERQLFIPSRAFPKFSVLDKVLAGCKKPQVAACGMLCRSALRCIF